MSMHTVQGYENRISLLNARDPVGNSNLIKKIERKKRKLEAKG